MRNLKRLKLLFLVSGSLTQMLDQCLQSAVKFCEGCFPSAATAHEVAVANFKPQPTGRKPAIPLMLPVLSVNTPIHNSCVCLRFACSVNKA